MITANVYLALTGILGTVLVYIFFPYFSLKNYMRLCGYQPTLYGVWGKQRL